jgi:hypothetical protein
MSELSIIRQIKLKIGLNSWILYCKTKGYRNNWQSRGLNEKNGDYKEEMNT